MKPETYFYKTPFWLRWFYPNFLWRVKTTRKEVFLTFDDGPTPQVTEWVLNILAQHHARATFFCLGNNVQEHPELYQQLVDGGHSVGNHSFDHENGWETHQESYLKSVEQAAKHIKSKWFRPPYGKIRKAQAKALMKKGYKIVMWDLVSGDFNESYPTEKSLSLLLKHTRPGSILVFHDSHKAFAKLQKILPVILKKLKKKGYTFEVLIA